MTLPTSTSEICKQHFSAAYEFSPQHTHPPTLPHWVQDGDMCVCVFVMSVIQQVPVEGWTRVCIQYCVSWCLCSGRAWVGISTSVCHCCLVSLQCFCKTFVFVCYHCEFSLRRAVESVVTLRQSGWSSTWCQQCHLLLFLSLCVGADTMGQSWTDWPWSDDSVVWYKTIFGLIFVPMPAVERRKKKNIEHSKYVSCF